ncbi:hypothetical protein PMV43_06370, partial [Enterococcus casseliflavus]|uniref:hypothetical protein n=1 Tax=Enterococcus casseliflavus TaxID=37734 RepID=UPI0023315406
FLFILRLTRKSIDKLYLYLCLYLILLILESLNSNIACNCWPISMNHSVLNESLFTILSAMIRT